jgi:palmitoyl-protein thioesterase
MRTQALSLAALLSTFVTALPQQQQVFKYPGVQRRPLVLWHGLGDSYNSEGMTEFADMIKKVHDGIFIHSIYVDEKTDEDRRAGFVSFSGT